MSLSVKRFSGVRADDVEFALVQCCAEGLVGASIGPALFMPAEMAPPSRSVTAQLAETAPTTTK